MSFASFSAIVLVDLLVLAVVVRQIGLSLKTHLSNTDLTDPLLFLITLGLAVIICWPDPYWASNLSTVPDSVEYAVAANRFFHFGTYDILIDGIARPPRYPPGFSLLVVVPSYFIFGPSLGNGVFGVFLFFLFGLSAAFLLGAKLAGRKGAVCAVVLLLSLPGFIRLQHEILSDGPVLALTLIVALAYLDFLKMPTSKSALAVGVLVAFAAALRPLSGLLILPFLLACTRQERRSLIPFCAAPLVLVAVLNMYYQSWTFGSPFRTGYHYWVSVPYEFPSLLLGVRYFLNNLSVLMAQSGIPMLLVLGLLGVLPRAHGKIHQHFEVAKLWEFLIFGIFPAILFHLFYFFPSARFYLPCAGVLTVFAAWGVAQLVTQLFLSRVVLWVGAFGLLTILGLVHFFEQTTPPLRRVTLDQLNVFMPEKAVVVSALEPVFVEPELLRGTSRKFIPVSRRVEYASKLITPQGLKGMATPHSADQHRLPELKQFGAKEAVSQVALEGDSDALLQGAPLYLETRFLIADELGFFEQRFTLQRIADFLFRLESKSKE